MAQMMMIYLKEEKYLEDILTALISVDITEASISEGIHLHNLAAYNIPIFAGFRDFLIPHKTHCKWIHAIVDDKKKIDQLMKELSAIGIDFEKEDIGTLVAFPLEIMKQKKE